jgi:hypothetical protein
LLNQRLEGLFALSAETVNFPVELVNLLAFLMDLRPESLHLLVVSGLVDGEGHSKDGGDRGEDGEEGGVLLDEFDHRVHGLAPGDAGAVQGADDANPD